MRKPNKTSHKEMKEHMAKFTNGPRPFNLVTGTTFYSNNANTNASKALITGVSGVKSRNMNGFRNMQC